MKDNISNVTPEKKDSILLITNGLVLNIIIKSSLNKGKPKNRASINRNIVYVTILILLFF